VEATVILKFPDDTEVYVQLNQLQRDYDELLAKHDASKQKHQAKLRTIATLLDGLWAELNNHDDDDY
jgi:hypothetical protein